MFLVEPLFESPLSGMNLTPAHLALAAVALTMASTYLLVRAFRLNPVVVAILSMLTTQFLAAWLMMLLLSHTAQPIRDASAWWARIYAHWNAVVYLMMIPLVSGPTSVLLLSWRKYRLTTQS